MVYCRQCGQALREEDLFCPHCGTAVRDQLPLPPTYLYEARKKDRTVVIIVAMVVVIVVLPILFSGLLYLMVMGFGPSGPSPSADLVVRKPSADVINFAVTGTSKGIDLNDVWIDVRSPGGDFSMSAGYGLDVDNGSMGGNGDITVTYYDKDADRMLSDNDLIVIRSTLGPLEQGQYEIRLEHGTDGATIAKAAATAP